MGLIKHVNILTALEMRALRYHNKGHAKVDQDKILYNKAMDKTGTIAKKKPAANVGVQNKTRNYKSYKTTRGSWK